MKTINQILHMHPRVDLPNGSYTLVPEGGDEGADGELQYMDVAQDLDQSSEGPKANLANERKPRIINPSFKIMQLPLLCLCIYISGVELEP
jgi:hypothetical protein